MSSNTPESSNIEKFTQRIEKACTVEGLVDSLRRRILSGIDNLSFTGRSLVGKDCTPRENGITHTLQNKVDQLSQYVLSKLNSQN